MIRVLSVASEVAPLIKTGGLADVVGALPGALASEDVDMRILLPGYPDVMAGIGESSAVWTFPHLFGGMATLRYAEAHGLKLYVVDAPHLYDRAGNIYVKANGEDYEDNPQRFAALCRAGAEIAAEGAGDWAPELLHCHDWQAGLVPVYLREQGAAVPSIITIHNMAFQGLAPAGHLGLLGLPDEGFDPEGFEYYGQISALKAALVYCERITTVSPTYAEELTRPEFGMGLDGVIRARSHDLHGILNGIDTDIWDPADNEYLETTFERPRGKKAAKIELRGSFGLGEAEGPLCIVVSRLTQQKGLDMLIEALPELLERGGQLALIGTGDADLEDAFRDLADREPHVAVRIEYNEPLAHRAIAGGDAILVPSRFEPCGLTQMFGLRYGTVPLVALTGGLADTVVNASDAAVKAGCATGLQFTPIDAFALRFAFRRLCALYADVDIWRKIRRNAMAHPVDWSGSARLYRELYEELIQST